MKRQASFFDDGNCQAQDSCKTFWLEADCRFPLLQDFEFQSGKITV
jgi:hypothetical protein